MMTKTRWPVYLFWLPYESPSCISLGPVSSSFLLSKRRRRGQGGCLVAIDVNGQSPPGSGPELRVNKRKVAPNTLQGCKREASYGRLARGAVRLLADDQEMERVRPLPPRIRCGQLRSAVRSVFPDGLTLTQELSLKTVAKLEKETCQVCLEAMPDPVQQYIKKCSDPPPPLNEAHLARFKRAVAINVPVGWNKRKSPYIPTGNASLFHTRKGGGSWNDEPWSRFCRADYIISNGKPRIVTMYSASVTQILSPLHEALYACFQRKGWLLVGEPTREKVEGLNGDGDYVSVDYKNATDNIRREYIEAMVDTLKTQSVGLTEEELKSLDLLAEFRIAGVEMSCQGAALNEQEDWDVTEILPRGQPMGCLMSFPLLCLINKVSVDLALADLLEAKEISWKEFRVHRCLINGDDLLYREPKVGSLAVRAGILRNGSLAGLVLNEEKTIVDPQWAEVNSTAFLNGVKQKKTNVGVLNKTRDVTDPVGYLADSVVKRSTFRRLLWDWRSHLRNARRKVQGPIPPSFFKELLRATEVRDALCWAPSGPQTLPNPFPVIAKPAGYDLTREEEVCYISERVARLKCQGYKKPQKTEGVRTLHGEVQSIQRALRKVKEPSEDKILKVLADGWEKEQWKKLHEENDAWARSATESPGFCGECYEGVHSKAQCLTETLRAFKQRKFACLPEAGRRSSADGEPSPVVEFIALE
uniref:RNA-dependent RNA polymerase n=1 Tax=Alashan Botou tick virus 1 TaxID=2972061 RepID=A0A9E7V238_9VIRU|nr:MAG: RNA-dependent RNA polymerase [Alashan Botou tick virus 1]